MAGEDVRLKATEKSGEDELNLLKNQVQQTLLDIREHILDVTNPFNNAQDLLADEPKEAVSISAGGGGAEGQAGADAGDAAKEKSAEEGGATEEILSESPSVEDELAALPEDDILTMGDAGVDELVTEQMSAQSMPQESFITEEAPSMVAAVTEEEEETEAEGEEDDEEEESEEDDAEEPSDPEKAAGHGDRGGPATLPGPQIDMVTLAALVRWVSVTTQALGRNRVEVLLDTYELAGRITPQVKNIIKTLCSLADEDPDGRVPVRDVLAAMVRMEGLVGGGRENASAHRLMAILLDDDDDPLTRLGLRG